MNYNTSNTKNSTVVVKAACAIVFCLFSFVYLYFYQVDMLSVAQHILSGGVTRYDRLIGALVITLSLFLLQLGISVFCRFNGKYHALTYFPSLLILAIITDIGPEIVCGLGSNHWLWFGPLALLLWFGVAGILKKYRFYEAPASAVGIFSRTMWINIMIMTVMLLFVGIASDSYSVFHYRMHVERCLMERDIDKALETGKKSLETDSDLTMLRIYALARSGRLGDELFTYPVAGTSDDIIPSEDGAHCIIYPNDSIYKFLGAKPSRPVKALTFLKGLIKHNLATDAVRDYILCGYLIDRNLDSFIYHLPKFYEIDDSLPRHYREALILYTHQRSNPALVYHNVVMDTDFNDMQALERQYKTEAARKRKVFGQYAGTYWWYYKYMK